MACMVPPTVDIGSNTKNKILLKGKKGTRLIAAVQWSQLPIEGKSIFDFITAMKAMAPRVDGSGWEWVGVKR